MAVIHHTTLTPSKLELLVSWLPAQPWYLGTEDEPRLTKAGGFRLDDPHGEVGIEFMAVTDESGDQPLTYQVPLSYRGTPLDGADHALIGTAEHGVLRRRWIYDGAHDPVLVAQLFALVLGEAEPQAQSTSDMPDPSVTSHFTGTGRTASIRPVDVINGPHGTDLLVRTVSASGLPRPAEGLTLRVNRVLRPERAEPSAGAAAVLGHVTADWRLPDGTTARGPYTVVRATAPGPTR
ncbi:maltokinase N-terminal cap-like domain-containing protein [Streptomyces sp. AK02-01A]|uniref:maltokinase N-terminal cap-like domain-containing protein n=1 Tax=Streptomyces sp. AK02-01A TaxID=3028648 RepID=UPI0029BB83A1|nr:1,4-alpha-glucan branching protein [Streptomyces sp. AK02-01A]MDX3854446.1 1,4-alpha-glucan branching protein [Streptomyces sp. AK02-01A]